MRQINNIPLYKLHRYSSYLLQEYFRSGLWSSGRAVAANRCSSAREKTLRPARQTWRTTSRSSRKAAAAKRRSRATGKETRTKNANMKANKQEQQKSSNRKAQIESHRKGDKGQQGKHEEKQVGAAAASNKPEKKMRFKINNLVFFTKKLFVRVLQFFFQCVGFHGWAGFGFLRFVLC